MLEPKILVIYFRWESQEFVLYLSQTNSWRRTFRLDFTEPRKLEEESSRKSAAKRKYYPVNNNFHQTRSRRPQQFFELSNKGKSRFYKQSTLDNSPHSSSATSATSDFPPEPLLNMDHAEAAAPIMLSDASFINPSLFHGKNTEDARAWMNYLENWVTFKTLTPENQSRLFPLLFREAAADWFASLVDAQKDTLEHLKTAFESRFYPTELTRWQTMSDIWSIKQQSNETVDEYVSRLLKLARIAQIDDADTKRYAAIKGLLPEIRKHVLQQNPTTLAEVISSAKIAEQAMKSDGPHEFVMAMSRIEDKLDSMSLTNPSTHESFRSKSSRHTDTRQPQRRDSSYDDQSRRSFSPAERRGNFRSPSPYQRQPPSTFGSDQRSTRSIFRQGAPSSPTNTSSQHRVTFERTPTVRYNNSNSFNRQNSNSFGQPNSNSFHRQTSNSFNQKTSNGSSSSSFCMRCGSTRHLPGRCKVLEIICYQCGKTGHLAHMCQSARFSKSQ